MTSARDGGTDFPRTVLPGYAYATTTAGTAGIEVGRQWGEAFWTAADIVRAAAQAEAERMARLMPVLELHGATRVERATHAP